MSLRARTSSEAARALTPPRAEWQSILTSQNWSLALEETERGNQLRQASPMATILPNEVRPSIIRKVKALKDDGHATA